MPFMHALKFGHGPYPGSKMSYDGSKMSYDFRLALRGFRLGVGQFGHESAGNRDFGEGVVHNLESPHDALERVALLLERPRMESGARPHQTRRPTSR